MVRFHVTRKRRTCAKVRISGKEKFVLKIGEKVEKKSKCYGRNCLWNVTDNNVVSNKRQHNTNWRVNDCN